MRDDFPPRSPLPGLPPPLGGGFSAPGGYAALRPRLFEGRPLLMDADVGASLRARGLDMLWSGALGAVLYQEPSEVKQHHLTEVANRVDVLSAFTADTSPRSLAEAGMEHRAARLTGLAIDLAVEAAEESSRPVAVAGVLGSDQISATRQLSFENETLEHAERIAVAGAELVIVRGMASRLELVWGVLACSRKELPCWAVIDSYGISDAEIPELARSLSDAGAEALLFEVASVDEGLRRLERVSACEESVICGALLSAGPEAVRGFPSELSPCWVDRVVELVDAGARIVGGGAGTTEEHTRALSVRLGVLHPSVLPVSIP